MRGGFKVKKLKMFWNYFIFFIIGNVVFNTIYSAVKVIVINEIGGNEKYIDNWLLSFKETIFIYAIIYLIFIMADLIMKKTTINRLNEKLEGIKKGGEKDEK